MTRWKTTDNLPGNATVTLYFAGLMAFCYNKKNQCEIGFYESGKHSLNVEVFRNGKSVYSTAPTVNVEIEVGIENKSNHVRFFNGPDDGEFNRDTGDSYDFRWLLDLEDDKHHDKKLDKKPNYFHKKLYVCHGTFYTALPTISTFMEDDGPAKGPCGHVARVMAANIPLAAGEKLMLKINGKIVSDPIIASPGISYMIVFTNECQESGKPCKSSDFDLVFDLIAEAVPKVHLVKQAKKSRDERLMPFDNRSTDEAPCMGAGFGGTGGFPPP